ncbi:MAG: carbonic anhydrase, partial [Planctomycetota bacterium]|nr:carbonic anhydrase [Planctomycetota bacterium]
MAPDPSSIDGTDALRRLLEGNRRFVGGSRLDRDLAAEVAAGASGQAPFAAIVGCIDSRAAAELVFD